MRRHFSAPKFGGFHRLAAFALVALTVIVPTSAAAAAGPPAYSPLGGKILELTTLIPPTGSITAYTVPLDAPVVLTRFCRDDCVSCEGGTLGKRAFDTGQAECVQHRPGVELPPGEIVRCTNRCSTMNAALFSGTRQP